MKKNTNIVFLLFLFFMGALFVLVPESIQAQNVGYQLLENIPGTAGLSGNDLLPGYVSAIYKVALIVVTLSAVLMLSVGGFMYLTSAGNTSAISTAKGIIYDSLIGLVIALSAWLILYIINPDLIKVTITPPPSANLTGLPSPTPSGTSPTGASALPPSDSVELAKQIIANPNIKLSNSGDCRDLNGPVTPRLNMQNIADGTQMVHCFPGCNKPGANKCTQVTGISQTMLRAIWKVGQTESFTISSIAGGPHGDGSTHYSGRAIDISTPITWNLLKAFIEAGAIAPNRTGAETCAEAYCGLGNGGSMCELNSKNVGCTAGSGADHIHLVFSN